MPANSEFFAQPRPAAAFKHGILRRYPVVFAGMAGSVTAGRVVFLDGYAGSGQYDDGSPGSPLLFVGAAMRSVEMRRTVTAIFVEQHPDRYARLCEVLAAADAGGVDYRLVAGDLGAHLPQLLPVAAGCALFAFLDPFGTALDREQLRRGLLGRAGRAPTEVLLNFSVSTVARIGGLLRGAYRDDRVLEDRDRKTVATVDRFLGGTWWQEPFRAVAGEQDLVTATDIALDVANRYCQSLAAETGFRSVSMPVRPAPMRDPKYVLVLFTRHPEGVWKFASALGGAGLDWQRAVHDAEQTRASAARDHPGQHALFEIAPEPFDSDGYERPRRDSWAGLIAENIQQLLNQHGDFPITHRTVEVYGSLLGQAWERHIRRAVKDLHRVGAIANDGKYEFHQRPLGPVRLPGQRGRTSSASVPGSRPTSGPEATAPRPSGFDRPIA